MKEKQLSGSWDTSALEMKYEQVGISWSTSSITDETDKFNQVGTSWSTSSIIDEIDKVGHYNHYALKKLRSGYHYRVIIPQSEKR